MIQLFTSPIKDISSSSEQFLEQIEKKKVTMVDKAVQTDEWLYKYLKRYIF